MVKKCMDDFLCEEPNEQYAFIMSIIDMVDSMGAGVGEHATRTSLYSQIIAEELVNLGFYTDEIDDDFITKLFYSAPLHDIGKVYIPDKILNKPGPLTNIEFDIMKKHAQVGAEIIDDMINDASKDAKFKDLLAFARDIVLYHHEKWDGSGYPCGLSGYDIPLSARILAISDVFDAISSKRVYKEPMPIEDALELIVSKSGTHFDPRIVSAFLLAFDAIKEVLAEKSKIK